MTLTVPGRIGVVERAVISVVGFSGVLRLFAGAIKGVRPWGLGLTGGMRPTGVPIDGS
jgi:hypothetical protein